jgi:hypothetical protein
MVEVLIMVLLPMLIAVLLLLELLSAGLALVPLPAVVVVDDDKAAVLDVLEDSLGLVRVRSPRK